MRNRDLSRQERVFGIWKFVSSPRVGGHLSFLAPISARRHERRLVNGLDYLVLRYRQVTFLASNVEAVFSEQVNQSAPCLPDVDWPRAFTARNTKDDVIWSASEMPRDLNLSSWWWKWGWLDNVRTGTTDWFVGKVPGFWAGWPEEIRCLFSFIRSLDIPTRNFGTRKQFQNRTQLQITISLFYVSAKHPEEGSNAETSVYLYRH